MESSTLKKQQSAGSKKDEIFDNEDSKALPQTGSDRLKKQSSYTYWVQNNKEQFPQHQDKSIIQPKKIDDPELLKKLEEQTNQLTLNRTGSAWNKAGTWYVYKKLLLNF